MNTVIESQAISVETKQLKAVETDFGAVFRSNPVGLAKPRNTQELQALVKECALKQLSIIPRGMSHSASGQCLSQGGVVIDTKGMDSIHEIQFDGESGTIKVDAGLKWEQLVRHSLKYGAAPEVLTDWQKLTVGGTLSTGGLGFMSHQHGIQADHVVEMEVVSGEGELFRCSRRENAELFNLVRGGLGQYGIIATATIRLVKAPKKMHVFKMLIDGSADFHRKMMEFQGAQVFSCIHSFLIPNTQTEFRKKFGSTAYARFQKEFEFREGKKSFSYFVELVQYEYEGDALEIAELPDESFAFYELDDFFDYVTKEPPLISTQKEKGKTAHPELAVFISESNFEEFMQVFVAEHDADHMGDGPVLVMPIKASKIESSAFVGLEEDFYFIGILRNAYPNTAEHIDFLSKLNESLYHKALRLGGKRYPCDSLAFPKSKEQWQAHFGCKWTALEEGKRKYDPNHRLRSLLTIHQCD